MGIISIIVAVSENSVIGKDNDLIWYLPRDKRHFRNKTMGKPVVMGRKTYESIPDDYKPLEGRQNIIMTRNKNISIKGCDIAHSAEEALDIAIGSDEIMIAGGEEIYKEFLPYADIIYRTIVHHPFEGDRYFPEFNESEWEITEEEVWQPDEKNKYVMTFQKLRRLAVA